MRNTRFKALLLCASALALTTTAHAQTASTAAKTDTSVGEVVVTASKRAERLQDVPQAVTVVGGAQLEQQNITNAEDLARAVPTLTAGPDQLRIRGIGTFSFARTSEASVGVVVDGVAIANAGPVAPQLFDVSRVEVLPGPQGTLFGRNSSAGVLNIVTNAPDPAAYAASGEIEGGTRNEFATRAVVNLPLSSDAALRVTGAYSRLPDTVKNVISGSYPDDESGNVRARLLWNPTDAVSINLIGDYSHTMIMGGGQWAVYNSTPGSLLTQELATCGITPSTNNSLACDDGGNISRDTSWGGSGQIDYRFGGFTLTSLTAYRGYDHAFNGDSDSTPLNILDLNAGTYRVRNFSEELRLTSPAHSFIEYVVGLYYFNSDQDYTGAQAGTLGFVPSPLTLGQDFITSASNKSYAAFGQSTVHLTTKLRLLIGGRVNREEVEASTTRTVHPGSIAPFGSVLPVAGSDDDDSFSYRLGAEYDFTHDVMGYVTFNRGYKGPAINDQAASAATPIIIKPEIPKAWEVGLKSQLFDRRLILNLAAFRTHTTNFQTQFYDPTILGYVFGNAPELTTQGVSLDLLGRLAPGWTVSGGAVYTDATYGKGYFVACSQGQTAAQGCQTVAGGTTQDANGTPLAGVPKFKLNLSTQYRQALTDRFDGYFQADAVYTTKIYYGQGFDPLNSTGEHLVVGGRVGVRTKDDRIGVSLFVRNLFDERVPVLTFATPVAAQLGDPRSYVQFFGSDSFRVVGASLDARF